jgi:hypothetical protein
MRRLYCQVPFLRYCSNTRKCSLARVLIILFLIFLMNENILLKPDKVYKQQVAVQAKTTTQSPTKNRNMHSPETTQNPVL